MKQTLFRLAFVDDLNGVRFMLALGALFVGLGLLWPSEIFPQIAGLAAAEIPRTTYLHMAHMAPEWVWGAMFTFQGSIMLWSLIKNHRSRLLLWLDAALGCFLWTTAILSCYASYWVGFDNILEYKLPAIMGGKLASVIASWWVLVRYSVMKEDDNATTNS